MFEGALDGPWLMIDLPRGRYSVEAQYGNQTLRRTATIEPGDHDRMVLYFDEPGAEVGEG